MTDQTQTLNADGQKTTDAAEQTTSPTPAADTTALTAGDAKQQQETADTTALTGDAKPAEGDADATSQNKDTKTEADKAKSQVPDKYEFTAPEGSTLNEGSLAQFSEVSREIGLSQEQAQAVITKMAPVIAAQSVEAVRAAQAEWKASQLTDSEFGGEHLAANLGIARKALQAFGTPELTQLLNQSGLGDHPEILRAFYRAGKAISEDTFVSGNMGRAQTDPASVMFPSMKTSA